MSAKALSFDDDGDLLLHLHASETEELADMTVSSKHLILASPVFKAMFRPDTFREGELLKSRDLAEVDLPDDDPEAFEILMNILHGWSSKVPEQVTLELLTKLSVLADKYQILEPLTVYLRQWWPELKKQLPGEYDANVPSWLSICWVFKFKVEFEQVTKVAMRGCNTKILIPGATDLPIPERLIDSIEEHRQAAVGNMFTAVSAIITRYDSKDRVCTSCDPNWANSKNITHRKPQSACDALVIGTLIQELRSNGFWPLPVAPFDNFSITDVAKRLRSLEIISLQDLVIPRVYGSLSWSPIAHGLRAELKEAMAKIEAPLLGIDLELNPIGAPKRPASQIS